MKPTLQRSTLAIIVLLVIVGFALRLYHINAVSIRGDEVFTLVYWMRHPLSYTIEHIATKDPQPILAYALFRGWGLSVGMDERLARLLPALLSVIGIPALYALGKRLGGGRVGLLAALLWTVHPYQIWHAQDARNYAIWSSISVVGVWLALRLSYGYRRPLDWLLYVLMAVLAAYVYYLQLFIVAALSLYVLIVHWRDRRFLVQWFAAHVIIGLVLAPWYLQARLLSGGGYGGTTGGFQAGQLLTRFLPALNFGETLSKDGDVIARVSLVLLAILVAGAFALWRRARKRGLFPSLLGAIPLLLLAIVSLKLNVFEPRYVLGTSPAFVVLVSAAVIGGSELRNSYLRFSGVVVLFVWLFVSMSSLNNQYFVPDYAKSPDWPAVTGYLADHAMADDLIVQAAADEAFNYYYDTFAVPSDRKQLPASPQQSVSEIVGLLDADLQTHSSIWLVAQTFPDWPSAGVVERWAQDHMQMVRNTSISGIRVQQFKQWSVDTAEVGDTPLAVFENVVELAGTHVLQPGETGDDLTVWLIWRPLAQTDTALKVFVQLIGPTNPATGTPLWTQDDQFPQDGRIDTTTWATNTLYRDIYTLPLGGVPPGEYTLVTGLYDPTTGERLAVNGSDSYVIQTIATIASDS
jgi:hypothetical protein